MKSSFPHTLVHSLTLAGVFMLSGASSPAAAPPRLSRPAYVDNATECRLANFGARLVIEKSPWKLQLLDAEGRVKFAEARPPAFLVAGQWAPMERVLQVEPEGEQGARLRVALAGGGVALVAVRPFGPSGFQFTASCEGAAASAVRGCAALDPVEEIYGFGEMWNGHVAQRGQSFELWDKGGTPDECAYMPFYVSTRNYAFFLNYGGRVRFDVGQRRADEIVYEAPADRLDVTLVSGDSIASTVGNVLSEVGLPARPPRWAFEPWFWLMGDPGKPGAPIGTLKDHHFIEMIAQLRKLDIPVGVTWFEPPWQTARTTFIPNPEFTADMPALIKKINDLGVHALGWTVPYTTGTASNWKEAVERGYLVRKPGAGAAEGKVAITKSGEIEGTVYTAIDYFNPEAAAWWQRQIAAALELGLEGFKLDAGQDLPPDALLHQGRLGRDVHNSYAYPYNRVFGEALRRKYGDNYLMIPRAAWLGSSAYGNFKWPGDLSGSFADNGLPSSVYSSLSLAFCGVPFVATDIGGFQDKPAPEDVWIRWAQFGAMLPGFQTLHMPWWYSKRAAEHFRYLAWLHTDLIPLWNSLAHEAHDTGAPVCRPLVWTFQDDVDGWRVDDEFTVGPSLLVAPITNPELQREVYLPAGRWFDFWDESLVLDGARTVTWFKRGEGRWMFPLYIREGAIIPMEVVNDVTGFGTAESKGCVTLAIWPKREGASAFTLHDREDAVPIEVARAADGAIKISWGATKLNHLLRIHVAEGEPLEVRGADVLPRSDTLAAFRARAGAGWCYDASRKTLWVRQPNDGHAVALGIGLRR